MPKIRIPDDIREAMEIDQTLAEEVPAYHYDNGQARLSFCSNGPRDYYLWSEKRQSRIDTWSKAEEMWAYLRECLALGPDQYGMLRLA